METFFCCGKSGHRLRDCPSRINNGKYGSQPPPSGSSSSAPNKNRFYALQTRHKQEGSPDVVIDVLIDPFSVSTPTGASIVANRVYRSCLDSLSYRVTHVDLVKLDMLDFDVILGMDWLHSFYASVDCRN
ncbi:hypothetical protein MTR67_002169 [Solanum verrucosum]|uniref:CCHC-type domain-containing protein n=1 Tax=Solanum verrucosum TaxID=315347 RepID=A0AAF0T8I0_SOLVR|nr:hypothetical protein MTR67_002169 [Solanum verrucosum]